MSNLKYGVGDKLFVEVVVKRIDKEGHYLYFVEAGYEGWWVSEDDLISPSSVTATTSSLPSNTFNVEVGDIVLTTNGLKLIADYIGKDYIHSNEYGETFYFHEIAAIYKPTWKKEKTLEEMSREELIARIKQLEQGE